MPTLSTIQYICVAVIPVLFAITVHEVAHGWVAKQFGDQTASMLGRLSLNPIRHIDPVGTIVVPAVMLLLGGFLFGWAKPVPVDPRNFNKPKQTMIWVAIAGPLANLVMAFMWAMILKLSLLSMTSEQPFAIPVYYMAQIGIQINIVLFVLNLIPVPPLDGSKILMGILPGKMSYKLSLLEPYGFFIVLALIYFGVLNSLLRPVLAVFLQIIKLFGL